MGYEIIKAGSAFKLWNTRIDCFEFQAESVLGLLSYIEKKHKTPMTKEVVMGWMESAENAPTEEAFFAGMRTISAEMIKKFASKQ